MHWPDIFQKLSSLITYEEGYVTSCKVKVQFWCRNEYIVGKAEMSQSVIPKCLQAILIDNDAR